MLKESPLMGETRTALASELELIGAALALGAESVPEWSAQERELVAAVSPPRPSRRMLAALREQITLLYALVTGLLLASMFRRTEGSR
jgi:hypothetical protein